MTLCPTCAGFGYALGDICWDCKGTGVSPPAKLSARDFAGSDTTDRVPQSRDAPTDTDPVGGDTVEGVG